MEYRIDEIKTKINRELKQKKTKQNLSNSDSEIESESEFLRFIRIESLEETNLCPFIIEKLLPAAKIIKQLKTKREVS